MLDVAIPDLTFPMVKYGRNEIPLDLRILLYKGGAATNSREVFNRIASGELGHPLIDRIDLVKRIHEEMTASLVGGGAKETAKTKLDDFRAFFAWSDEFDQVLSLETVEDTFRHWCDFLLNRQRLKEIKAGLAYKQGVGVSSNLDAVLERSQPLITTTRLRKKKRSKRAVGVAADKQNLSDTFAFGHFCLDIIDNLPLETVFGSLPVQIRLRDGRMLEQWSGLRDPARLVCLQPGYRNKNATERVLQQRAAREADRTLRTRYPLVNLRIMIELLVFIAQTGMNLSQAHNLQRTQYSYKSIIDGFEVRNYKERRKGEVLFEIFAEYKQIFANYLTWRDKVFGEKTDRLFPLVREGGALDTTLPNFYRLKHDICEPLGITFVPPQKLRNTRVSWLLRQSHNPELTAEQAQHTKQTLLRIYEKPSLQVAQVEIILFWQKNDPRLGGNPKPCPAPGVCNGVPKPMPNLPPEAPKPNCTQPSGCLFCSHHRDIDSADYVWSVMSMRYLNNVILQRLRPAAKSKADAVRYYVEITIDMLTAKLKWFKESNGKRRAWVEEATEKLDEGEFHAHWRYLIESA